MASGNQTCSGNCADLPTAPKKIPKPARVSTVAPIRPNSAIPLSWATSSVPVSFSSRTMAARKPKSPTRVTIKAFLAALAAEGF